METQELYPQVEPVQPAEPPSKPFWQSKTNWVNALIFLLAMVELFSTNSPFDLSPDMVKMILMAQAVGNIALRFLTETKVTWK